MSLASVLACGWPILFSPATARAADPAAQNYLNLIIDYSIYSKSIWHDTQPPDIGGYWGPVGIAEHDQNGAIRGMVDTMTDYAYLIHLLDTHGLTEAQQQRLQTAGLDRAALLKYICANLTHITAHHASNLHPLPPTWGFSWQSTMWTGFAGPTLLLLDNDIPNDLKDAFKRVAFAEAERIVVKPPKTYLPGDTGAEENAWDTYAPAMALALDPTHPRAAAWFKALKIYAVNTYSHPADRTSSEKIGNDVLKDLISTTNLFDDFTLENHHIFHPDYVQVSGQELGDSLQFLELADKLHHTHLANEFAPYAMHHVKDVWEKIAKPLLLPTGEYAFPNGSDWQLNCSQMPAYLGFIASHLQDPAAYLAWQRLPRQAMRHEQLSAAKGSGRIFGDTNMEWFWEPICTRRSVTTLIDFELHPAPQLPPDFAKTFDTQTTHRLFPNTNVWFYRNPAYFAAASWGDRHMGVFYPLNTPTDNPYFTIPIDGILPGSAVSFETEQLSSSDDEKGVRNLFPFVVIKLKDNRRCALICLPHSVLWLSPEPLRALSIENDPFSGGKRTINSQTIESFKGGDPFNFSAAVNIDDTLSLITTGDGFRYTPTNKYNRRSYAYEQITPLASWGAWQMAPSVTSAQTPTIASAFSATLSSDQATVKLMDGADGPVYTIHANLGSAGQATITITKE